MTGVQPTTCFVLFFVQLLYNFIFFELFFYVTHNIFILNSYVIFVVRVSFFSPSIFGHSGYIYFYS